MAYRVPVIESVRLSRCRVSKLRAALALVFILASFVGLLNLAVIWHGALFVLMVPVWGVAVNRALDWARAVNA